VKVSLRSEGAVSSTTMAGDSRGGDRAVMYGSVCKFD
jgi:hypothetical protein